MPAAALIVTLSLLHFYFTLTLYLRGSKRDQIASVVAIVMFVVVGFAFFWFGWKIGLAAIAVPLLIGNLTRPLAARLAHRLLGYRTGMYEDRWSGAVRRQRRFEGLMKREAIRAVLMRHGTTLESLEELYQLMLRCGLQDIAMDIISDPRRLDRALELRKEVVSYESEVRFEAEMRERRH